MLSVNTTLLNRINTALWLVLLAVFTSQHFGWLTLSDRVITVCLLIIMGWTSWLCWTLFSKPLPPLPTASQPLRLFWRQQWLALSIALLAGAAFVYTFRREGLLLWVGAFLFTCFSYLVVALAVTRH